MATATKEQTTTGAAAADMSDGSNAGKEVTTTTGAPPAGGPQTQAQQRKAKLEKILKELAARAENYRPLLQAHGITWEIFTAILQQAFVKVPALLECSTASILQAALMCAKDGLMPDGDEAAITPFKKTATYVPGYKGLLKCAYAMRDGNGALVYQDVEVDVVYEDEDDKFEYRRGDGGFIHFSPPLDRSIEKPVIGAYAIIRTNNGGVFREVIGGKELAKIANVNKSTNGPRAVWGAEMHKKGPLRRLLKKTPKDQRLVQVLQNDEQAYINDSAALIDGDTGGIPDDKLFDDRRHVEDESQLEQENDAGEQVEDTDDAEGNPVMVQVRADFMATDNEAALDALIVRVKSTADAVLSSDEREVLLKNAEDLRAHRWPKAETEAAEERPTSQEGATETAGAQTAGEEQDMSASAGSAPEASQGQADSSPKQATEKPADGAPAAEGGVKVSTVNNYGGFTMAEQPDRLTPQEALLADEDVGVHFKAGIAPNASGQVPMFNGANHIVGWAKPDLDIPTREYEPPGEGAPAPKAADKPAAEKQQITESPEDRKEPEPEGQAAGEDDDGGYGEAATTAVFRMMVHPQKPPKEYADAVEWRDAMIFKMGSLNATAAPMWWKDNLPHVEAAISAAKAAAGRVIAQAATRKLAGAKELVDQYGPFQ